MKSCRSSLLLIMYVYIKNKSKKLKIMTSVSDKISLGQGLIFWQIAAIILIILIIYILYKILKKNNILPAVTAGVAFISFYSIL